MGRIKQGILGGFLGKVGGVVGSNWKGIATMRAMPLSVSNPKTAAQQLNRGRFAQVVDLAGVIGVAFIRNWWNRQAVKMSGFNLFCRENAYVFDESGVLNPAIIKMSLGSLTPPTIEDIIADASARTVTVDYEYPIEGNHLPTDVAELVVLNAATMTVVSSGEQSIATGVIAVNCPVGFMAANDTVWTYLCVKRADGTQCSTSVATGAVVQA